MAGSAVKIASEALRDRAVEAAAILLQTESVKLQLADGAVSALEGGASIRLGEIAGQLEETGGLKSEGWFRANHMT